MAASFLACCGQAPSTGNLAKNQDTMLLAAKNPPAPVLPAAEYHHFNNASKHFFDSLFQHGFNGGILVARDGEVVYERYSGFKNVRKKLDSVNAHTAFHLASVSKTFTAMGVLKLWEEGKLDIHDDIS